VVIRFFFQTGESWHDNRSTTDNIRTILFDELSISFSQKFDFRFKRVFLFWFIRGTGLGPPTFMHRLSAMDDPTRQSSHHWQDSTHITLASRRWARNGAT